MRSSRATFSSMAMSQLQALQQQPVCRCLAMRTPSACWGSASISGSLPYGVGNFHGTVVGADTNAYRSGRLDSSVRLSMNLKGGPAMDLREFRKWQQKTLLGVSLKAVVPTGQYDPTKLINDGANRWAFKPEVGLSRRWGHWVVDGYGALWLFTTNSRNQFSPGMNTQKQHPTFAFEG